MTKDSSVSLRRIPHPYQAMLAVCSDLDETPDWQIYWEIVRFLNTTEATPMGPGLGLEVGNSIYFDMPPGQFAYWSTDDAGRAMVRELIRSGHIDCLHSYGDLATTRAHAGRALDELDHHGLKLEVWVDHGTAATNFGADIMQGHGDQPEHEAYHADLTLGQGMKYLWRGRVTSILGQDTSRRLGGIFTTRHAAASTVTLSKETAKGVLGRLGSQKYRIHKDNKVLQPCRLRDGRGAAEFLRCNPHWGGVSSCETGRGIGQVLSAEKLDALVQREGVCVLYTHLGKIATPARPFDAAGQVGLRRLAAAHHGGRILVTSTRRLLRYLDIRDGLTWQVRREGQVSVIDARTAGPVQASDLSGLTFEVAAGAACRLTVNGQAVETRQQAAPQPTGRRREILAVPWSFLPSPTFR